MTEHVETLPIDQLKYFVGSLTRREKQISFGILEGKTNNEIAGGLNITPQTVKFHITKIFKKLGVKSRSQFIVKVIPVKHTMNPEGLNF